MPLDPSIPLRAQGFDVQPAIDNYRTAQANRANLQGADQQRELRAEQLRAAKLQSTEDARKAHEDETIRGVFQVNDIRTPEGRQQSLQDFQHLGLGHLVPDFSSKFKAAEAAERKAQEAAHLDEIDFNSRMLSGIQDDASYQIARKRITKHGHSLDGLPEAFDPEALKGYMVSAMSHKERLEQQNKSSELALRDREVKVKEKEKPLDANWDKLEGASGVYLYNKKTGVIKRATDGNTPIEPKPKPGEGPKPIPPNVNAAIIENTQNLNRAKTALGLINGEKVDGVTGDKNATGWKGYVPQDILNRWDPKGVETRAFISDIGSMILHDRSGAAVTAAESPRLKPFIPLATDDRATAQKKMARFVQIYEAENNAYAQVYNEENGYRSSPLLSGKGASGSWGAPSGGGLVDNPENPGEFIYQPGGN